MRSAETAESLLPCLARALSGGGGKKKKRKAGATWRQGHVGVLAKLSFDVLVCLVQDL